MRLSFLAWGRTAELLRAPSPSNAAIATFTLDSVQAFTEPVMPHFAELQGDIPNYSDIEPVVQISDLSGFPGSVSPAFAREPLFPPLVGFFQLRALFSGQVRATLGNGPQRTETDGSTQLIHARRICKPPWSRAPIGWLIHPLCAESLRAALLHRDAIFEVRSMPRRYAALSGT